MENFRLQPVLPNINTKTTYKIVQYFVSFWFSHRRKYSTVATATTAFFSLTKPKITQNILDYFINRFGIISDFFNIHSGKIQKKLPFYGQPLKKCVIAD